MGSKPRDEERPPEPPKPARPPAAQRPRRDLAREDADSPHGIPLFPPQGDGS